MKTFLTLFMAISLVGAFCMTVAADEKDAVKELNGEWSVASMELGGKKLPEQAVKAIKLINKDGEYVVKAESDDKGTVTVDAGKTPKQMTIKGVDGPNKGKTMLCIYELKGDELKVCYDMSGREFPKEFKSEAGKLTSMLAVYKKSK
jgi:uncharacterized protein (TIGR03067 family)